MKNACQRPHRQTGAFTLLELVIVLAILALVLTAVYTVTQGTLTLADNVRRALKRESRQQAFTAFCENLFTTLPVTASLNLKTTQEAGQYLTTLDLENVPSPFDSSPNCLVRLFTESVPGGGRRLLLFSSRGSDRSQGITVVLFDDIAHCEWRAFDSTSGQWVTTWTKSVAEGTRKSHPVLIELTMNSAGESTRSVFWLAPMSVPIVQSSGM